MSACSCCQYIQILIVSSLFIYGNVTALNSPTALIGRDSTKQKYSARDTLDPNCPCYKYQRKAEREYQHLLNKELRKKKHLQRTESDKSAQLKEGRISKRRYFFYFSRKAPHKTRAFNFSRRREKSRFFKFFKKNIAACTF